MLNKKLSGLTDVQKLLLEKRLRAKKQMELMQDNGGSILSLPDKNRKYLITDSQKKIWLLCKLYDPVTVYNIGGLVKIKGKLNPDYLEEGLNALVQKHDSLRTIFIEENGEVYGRVLSQISFHMKIINNPGELMGSVIKKEQETVFDLGRAPALRAVLYHTGEDEWSLLIIIHHIISDGLSTNIIFRDLIDYYEKSCGYERSFIKETSIQYGDFAWWQMTNKERIQRGRKGVDYWKNRIQGYDGGLEFFQDCKLLNQIKAPALKIQINLDEVLVKKLIDYAKSERITVFSVLLGSLYLLINQYSGQNDILAGVLTAGRDHMEVRDIVGCFINVLPFRVNIQQEDSIKEYFQKVYQSFVTDYKNSEACSEIQESIPECQLLFSYEEDPQSHIAVKGLEMEFREIDTYFCRSEMEMELNRLGNTINGWLNYRSGLFSEEFIEHFLIHFKNMLNVITEQKDCQIRYLQWIFKSEIEQILNEFNPAEKEFENNKSLVHIFSERVEEFGDKTALYMGEKEISYNELDHMSNAVANTLAERGIGVECRVGISAERGVLLISGILGILKSGAAYVPIDKEMPEDRKLFIIKDSSIKYLLSDEISEISNLDIETILIKDCMNDKGYDKGVLPDTKPESLAYIIYTSGTTGVPKGVLVEHRQVIRTVRNNEYIEFNDRDRLLQLSSYVFDGSVFDIFGSLLNGVGLVLIDKEDILDINKVSELIKDKKVTIAFITTSLFNAIVDIDTECLKNLRRVYFGGEGASVSHVKKAYEFLGEGRIYNIYGPTEATVFSSYYPIHDGTFQMDSIPIGKPISNTKIIIVDKADKLQPIGVKGEILISGEGIARGYLNRSDLNKEKFVLLPQYGSGRWYRTGDSGKWLPSGDIVFCGRVDNQIKYRGFRIELGEIENALLENKSVEKTSVLFLKDDEFGDYLCAYVVTKEEVVTEELKQYLRSKLPPYMIPDYFVKLNEIPLNINGKTDKKKLPRPVIDSRTDYMEPETELEKGLSRIWKNILGTDKAGITDNFFDVGGHSIRLSKMCAQAKKELNIHIPLKIAFTNPTIKGILDNIDAPNDINIEVRPMERILEAECYETSATEKRMYFINSLDKLSTAYNIPFAVKLTGFLDIEKIRRSLEILADRHEILRSTYKMKNNEVVRVPHKEVWAELGYLESKKSLSMLVKEFTKPFYLDRLPLFRVQLVKINREEYYLMGDFHHIIFDGVSLEVFLRELSILYHGGTLEPLVYEYRDYAVWHNKYLSDENILKQKEYWINQFKTPVPQLEIPLDYKRPAIKNYEGEIVYFNVNSEITKELRKLVKVNQTTMNVVLLSVFNILLWKYTQQEDIVIGAPVAGRNQYDTQNMLGMFLNTLPLRNYPSTGKTVLEFIREVEKNFINGYNNQEYPFDQLIEDISIIRQMNRNPLFDILFIMQNGMQLDMKFDGINFELCNINYKSAKFDLQLEVYEKENQLDCLIAYDSKLFDISSIEQFIDNYKEAVLWASQNSDTDIGELEIINNEMNDFIHAFSQKII